MRAKQRFGAIFCGCIFLTGTALAHTRFVDPETLPPRQRAYALHGKLGDRDPSGRQASSGCQWSRIQVPTAQGPRWLAEEQCNPGMMR
jgi:hypothetical protein